MIYTRYNIHRYHRIIFYNRKQFEIDHIFNHIKFTRYNIFYDITDVYMGTISSVITRVDCIGKNYFLFFSNFFTVITEL